MTTKRVNELAVGDKLVLSDDTTTGVVTGVRPFPLIEVAGDKCYEVEWKDENGEKGHAIQAGRDEVQIAN